MPLWLEQFVNEHSWVIWSPLVLCVGIATALWVRQSRRGKGARGTINVGWLGAVATVMAVLIAIALAGYQIRLWSDVWAFVNEQPKLVAWWVAAVGGAVALWGVAVHAWRGEARLSRQCRHCGYDMTGVPGVMTCPECGRAAKNEKQLRPRNVRRGALWVGGLILLIAAMTPTGLAVFRRGPAAALPTVTLMWWSTSRGTAPESVLLELRERVDKEPEAVGSELRRHQRELIERVLDAPAPVRTLYISLLRYTLIEERDWRAVADAAVTGLASPDQERRRAAVQLGALSSWAWAQVPFATLRPLLADTDPTTARLATQLLQINMPAAIDAVFADGVTPDTEEARMLLRAASTAGLANAQAKRIERMRSHTDKEIAARATLLLFHSLVARDRRREGLIREAVLAVGQLDALGTPGPEWWTPVWWAGRRWVCADVVKLVDDPDPAVRRALLNQYERWRTTYIYQENAEEARVPLRRAIEARLDCETDAEALAVLQRVVKRPAAPAQP